MYIILCRYFIPPPVTIAVTSPVPQIAFLEQKSAWRRLCSEEITDLRFPPYRVLLPRIAVFPPIKKARHGRLLVTPFWIPCSSILRRFETVR